MKTLFKMATCVSVLVAMLFAAALSHGEFVMHFHQDMGHHAQQIGFTPDHPDRGYVKNCAPGGTYFNLSWSPKQLDPTKPIRFYADVVSPFDFDKGRAEGTLLYEGNPMVSFKKEATCDELSKMISTVMPSYAFHISCPVKKGQRLSGHYVFPNTERLIGFDGNYKLTARAWNSQGDELCIEIEAEVLPFSDY